MAGKHRTFYAQERGRGRQPDTLAAFPTMRLMRRWVALAPHCREPVPGEDKDVRAARRFEERTGVRVFVRPDMGTSR